MRRRRPRRTHRRPAGVQRGGARGARSRRGGWASVTLAAALLASLGPAWAQTESQATLERKDATLVLTLKAPAAQGGRFIINNRNCEDGVRTTLLYGPDPGYVLTQVDENTSLRSNVAVIRSPVDAAAGSGTAARSNGPAASDGSPATEGSAGSGGAPGSAAADAAGGATGPAAAPGATGGSDATAATPAPSGEDQTLELYDGTVTIDRPGCIASAERATEPGVRLEQGRTTVLGTRFYLDRGADTGTMDGPIQLDRAAQGDAAGLQATADGMVLALSDKRATLQGNVSVTSGDRVTTADTLELDEGAGLAVLTGQPARSTKGSDVLEGSRLLYYLDNNDVVVLGGVHGDLEVDVPQAP